MRLFLALSGALFLALSLPSVTVQAHGCNCGDHKHHSGGSGGYKKPKAKRSSGGRWVTIEHRWSRSVWPPGSIRYGSGWRYTTWHGERRRCKGGYGYNSNLPRSQQKDRLCQAWR